MISNVRLKARFKHLFLREASAEELNIMVNTQGSMEDKIKAVGGSNYVQKTALVIDASHCCSCKD